MLGAVFVLTLALVFGATGAVPPSAAVVVVTSVARTDQFAYDCHEGVCQVPEIETEPIPIFSNLLTRIRVLGVGLPDGRQTESGFRIAFAKGTAPVPAPQAGASSGGTGNETFSTTTPSSIVVTAPIGSQEETYAGASCEDYLISEVYKPVVPVVPPGKLFVGKPLIGSKLRAGKSRKDPTLVTQASPIFLATSAASLNRASRFLFFDVTLPPSGVPYKLCYKVSNTTGWVFTDPYPWLQIRTFPVKSRYLLPLWLEVVLIVFLFCLSGLFSGLNLGLMSLDQTELRLLEKSGTPNERKCTAKIMPLRRRGNFLLCTLVFGNVLVNSTLTILLENLSSGKVAVVISTIGITLFGEIIPQAVCARYGLEIGAKTVWITKFFMLITAPLAYPISLILDRLLGEDIGSVYDRQRLIELVKLTENYAQLGKEEVDIITGALVMKNKTVSQIMTPMRDMYMLDYDSILDFRLLTDIVNSGYTRIPVFEGHVRSNIVAVLNVKDLAFVDPDDKIPLKTVLKFYNHAITYVFEDTPLGSILEEFKKGSSHMAFVRRVINDGDKDPYYEITGLVTLEDVIEEIIQGEILDETDRLLDNRNKQVRHRKLQDFSLFIKGEAESVDSPLTPQMALVTYQFLNANVEPFKDDFISPNVLRKLIRQPDIIFVYNIKDDTAYRNYWNPTTDAERSNELYTKSHPVDYFILILEGRVRVYVGSENICFESGPFSYFGIQALNDVNMDEKAMAPNHDLTQALKGLPTFVPDYTVYPISSLLYLRVKRVQYLAARRATALEKSHPHTPSSPGHSTNRSIGRGGSRPPSRSQSPPQSHTTFKAVPNGTVIGGKGGPPPPSPPGGEKFYDSSPVFTKEGGTADLISPQRVDPLNLPREAIPEESGTRTPSLTDDYQIMARSPSLYGNFSSESRDSLTRDKTGSVQTLPLVASPADLEAGDGGSVRDVRRLTHHVTKESGESPGFRPRSYSHRISRPENTRSRTATFSDSSVITEEGGGTSEDEQLLDSKDTSPTSFYSPDKRSPRQIQNAKSLDKFGVGRTTSLTALFRAMGPKGSSTKGSTSSKFELPNVDQGSARGGRSKDMEEAMAMRDMAKKKLGAGRRRLTKNYDGTKRTSILALDKDLTGTSDDRAGDGNARSPPITTLKSLLSDSKTSLRPAGHQPKLNAEPISNFFPNHDIAPATLVGTAAAAVGDVTVLQPNKPPPYKAENA